MTAPEKIYVEFLPESPNAKVWIGGEIENLPQYTRTDLVQAAIAAKNAQILDLIEALRRRTDGEICGCGVDNPTDVCLSHYDVIEAVVRNRVQPAIAAAMMGAVKPLADAYEEAMWAAYWVGTERGDEWSDGAMSDAEDLAADCHALQKPNGWYSAPEIKAAIPHVAMRKAVAALSIPTDATAALEAVKAQAEQRGFDRAKERAAQIVDPAPNAKSGLWAENLRRKAAAIRAMKGGA